jgi:hypothetical protein
MDDDRIPPLFHPGDFHLEMQAKAALQERLAQKIGHLGVEPGEELGHEFQDLHLGSELLEGLGQLQADGPRPEDGHPPGLFAEIENGFVGEIGNVPETRGIGNEGSASGRDEKPPRANPAAARLERIRAREPPLAEDDLDAHPLEAPGLVVLTDVGLDLLHAPHDAGKIHPHLAGVDPELGQPPRTRGKPRRVDKRLRGDAAVIQAIAPQFPALDDRRPRAQQGRPGRRHQTGHPASDANEIELIFRRCAHLPSLSGGIVSRPAIFESQTAKLAAPARTPAAARRKFRALGEIIRP